MENIQELTEAIERAIGHPFKGQESLIESLTHRSYVNETAHKGLKDNERYEFLGDAVLQLVVSDYLMENHPQHKEGALSKFRSTIVNEKSLADIARSMDLGKYILLGKGEEITQGRKKDSILANAFEAMLAAIYVTGGIEDARKILFHFAKEVLETVSAQAVQHDYKTTLQEMTQRLLKKVPYYRLSQETGPDHDKVFDCEVIIDDRIYGKGKAKSKKESEQICAAEAIAQLKLEQESQK